jgi:hypothetical protein
MKQPSTALGGMADCNFIDWPQLIQVVPLPQLCAHSTICYNSKLCDVFRHFKENESDLKKK